MVSKRDLKEGSKVLGLYFLDEEEQRAKSNISHFEMMIQRSTETKQRFWRSSVRKCQSAIRRYEANLRRIQKVRNEIAASFHPRRRDGMTPDYYCEFRGCHCTNVEVKEVCGKPLTLCEEHGPKYSDELTMVSKLEMAEWANDHLKEYSARKWPLGLPKEIDEI